MARQLRHNTAGGWYHITARGMGRREIFLEDRDREHFVELMQGLVERYGIVLHAYVLTAVEAVKGESWADFADRKGDWGRDLALYVGRTRCGLTLGELGKHAGMNALAVSKAVTRFSARLETGGLLLRFYRRVVRKAEK